MGNSASALPYSIGDKVGQSEGWAIHDGSRKSDGAAVTVFQANKPTLAKTPQDVRFPQNFQITPVYHHYQNCKKLRHPHILNVYATLDTDSPTGDDAAGSKPANPSNPSALQPMATTGDLIVITEPCMPLTQWLAQPERTPQHLAWGLQCMVEALNFLHTSAKLAHGNVSEASWYVTPAGDVKLWNFSLVTPVGVADGGGGPTRYFREWESLVTPNAYRSPERRENRWDALATSGIHCMDSFGLSVMIGSCLYQNKIPGPLEKAVQRLQTSNLKMRPRLAPLLKCPVFETPYRAVQVELNQLSVQPVEAKVSFWQHLMPLLQAGTLDPPLAIHKVLPLMQSSVTTICSSESMLSQDFYRREILAILPPLFFISETYLAKEPGGKLAKVLTPMVALLFAVNDRGVRGALLAKANLLATHLGKNELNAAVFEPMCSGFSDSSAALRELTLKATLVLVPHLSPTNLEKLSRYLVRLQSDTEASIRTNTIVFISKLAPHLTEMNRQKMLLPAFIRAMKDPFTPCRLAALQSTLRAKDYFDINSLATKVLPAVTPQLLDPVADVRREAFAVVDAFLVVLRQEHDRMAVQEGVGGGPSAVRPAPVLTAPIATTAPVAVPAAPSSAGSGYLSGLSSWMSSSAKPSDNIPASASVAHVTAPVAPKPIIAPVPPPASAPTPVVSSRPPAPREPMFSSLGLNDAHIGSSLATNVGADGWDDDDDDDLLDLPGSKNMLSSSIMPMDDEDIFAALDIKPKIPTRMSASTSGSKLIMPKTTMAQRKADFSQRKTTRQDVAAKKLNVDKDDWDDF